MDLMTSIQELDAAQVKIYPNPTTGHLHIVVDGLQNYKCMVYDSRGVLLQTEHNNTSCNLIQFPVGLYHVVIEDLDYRKRIVERVVKLSHE